MYTTYIKCLWQQYYNIQVHSGYTSNDRYLWHNIVINSSHQVLVYFWLKKNRIFIAYNLSNLFIYNIEIPYRCSEFSMYQYEHVAKEIDRDENKDKEIERKREK